MQRPAEQGKKSSKKGKDSKAKAEVPAGPRQTTPPNHTEAINFNRPALEQLLKRRFFYAPSFEIYGGVAGLFDYGPAGCAVKGNMTRLWRSHFIMEEGMSEVDCSVVSPKVVLDASGHVTRFHDFMVRDVKTKDLLRADHLLEDAMDALIKAEKDEAKVQEYRTVHAHADAMTCEELGEALKKYGVKSDKGNDISDPAPFNLMFATQIGPSGESPGFMRPETAQGIFVNFKRLLEYNAGKIPFAAAQVGRSYRNEIAPRAGLLRVREFEQAEIEHFVHPDKKEHPKFGSVADLKLNLLPAKSQESGEMKTVQMTVGEAVGSKLIDNQTLGYFVARTAMWLLAIGIRPQHLRFRQHMSTEMAHYACDCWDAEIETSYGWIECVGVADRSAYDLRAHTKGSKIDLQAREHFDTPQLRQRVKADYDRAKMGRALQKQAPVVQAAIAELSADAANALEAKLASEGKGTVDVDGVDVEVTREMVKSIQIVEQKVGSETFFPSVIEPSFGIGRCLYAMLEHSFWTREGDEDRGVLSLMPEIAAVKTSVLPLMAKPEFLPLIQKLTSGLTAAGVSHRLDESSASIGKRYARTDEIGIPFGVTLDDDTVKDETVTLRERDTTHQIRIALAEVPAVLADLCASPPKLTWADVYAKYPHFWAGAQEAH